MRFISNREYKDLIHNKSVCIVGPSGYMKEYEFGSEIDSYDTIIRTNNALGIHEDFIIHLGKRTTILFASLAVSKYTRAYHDDYLNYIFTHDIVIKGYGPYYFPRVFKRNTEVFIQHKSSSPVKVSFMDESEAFFVNEVHKYFEPALPFQLTTGAVALLSTIFHVPKSLNIYGIGFSTGNDIYFSEKYHEFYKKIKGQEFVKKYQFHDLEFEKKIWRKFISIHDNINVDPYMKKILHVK